MEGHFNEKAGYLDRKFFWHNCLLSQVSARSDIFILSNSIQILFTDTFSMDFILDFITSFRYRFQVIYQKLKPLSSYSG